MIHLLSLKLGIGIGTLAGTIFGYVAGHHYKNNYRKDIQEAHAEAMDALEHVKIVISTVITPLDIGALKGVRPDNII